MCDVTPITSKMPKTSKTNMRQIYFRWASKAMSLGSGPCLSKF